MENITKEIQEILIQIIQLVNKSDFQTAEQLWINLEQNNLQLKTEIAQNAELINSRDAIETIYINKGGLAFKAGDFKTAEHAFITILEFEPKLTKVRYNLAFTYKRQGDFAKAETEFRKIVEYEPENLEMWKWIANMLIQQQKLDEAELILRDILKKDPNYREAYKWLDEVVRQRSKQKSSKIEIPFESSPFKQQIQQSQDFIKKGDYHQAIQILEDLLQKVPNQPMIMTSLGSAYFFTAQYEKAKKILTQVLSINNQIDAAKYFLQLSNDEMAKNKSKV